MGEQRWTWNQAVAAYHRRTDHARDGAPIDGFTCNCRTVLWRLYVSGMLTDRVDPVVMEDTTTATVVGGARDEEIDQ